MNKIILILSFFLIVLLYKFSFGNTSFFKYQELKKQVISIQNENIKFKEKIKVLQAEIRSLKTGLEVIEEKARQELGLIKENETFYQILK
tara:strand:- start:4661 stop:4930 length:270 start_codon:yes stop_codon:yes gene_type:complete